MNVIKCCHTYIISYPVSKYSQLAHLNGNSIFSEGESPCISKPVGGITGMYQLLINM